MSEKTKKTIFVKKQPKFTGISGMKSNLLSDSIKFGNLN